MDKKKLLLMMGALVIAIGTAFVARSMFAGASAPAANASTVAVHDGPRVLVAQRALPVGTIITADSIKFQEWPAQMVQDAYFIDGESDLNGLLGTVVRYPITAGEPVTQGSLVSPGDRGFLAAALAPGMRAVTIPISDRTGVAGFVFPGDRVDLVLTQTIGGDNGEALNVSETILQNIRVLATDQATTTEKEEDGSSKVRMSRTITVEVTPKIAEKVSVAQTLGTISLSLRSIADNTSDLERAIASGEVVVPDNASPEEEERILRKAAVRPQDSRTTYQTGGDVSRFQRSSIPPRRAANAPAERDTFRETSNAPAQAAAPAGPVIRVSRGNTVTAEPIGK